MGVLVQTQSLSALRSRAPTLPRGLVGRPGLLQSLTVGAKLPFTLVSAAAGSGKTMTAAAWAASSGPQAPVGWLGLDESTNDLRTFWSDLLRSLIASGGVPADSALRDVAPSAEFGMAEVQAVSEQVRQLPGPVVLIVDDFHLITSEVVLQSFGWLVDHQPPLLRLVVLTRSDPPLRLHRLRVNGELTEIRTADLAFTGPETDALFTEAGLTLRPEQVTGLMDRTDGWAVGLRLAAMSLDPADIDAGIDRFSGTHRTVADYLIGELLHRLPPRSREVLLSTSFLDQVSGPLADDLTGRTDCQGILEGLVEANAFVVALGGGREWFGYHPLLRELLRHRLTLERPGELPRLRLRAARWLTGHGEPIEGIRQVILGGDLPAASRALLGLLPLMLSPQGPALAAAIQPLARSADRDPSLAALLAAAACHFHRHEYVAMEQDAIEAGDFLDTADQDTRPAAAVAISLFRMTGARSRGDSAATITRAGDAIRILDNTPRQRMPAARQLRTIATNNLAGAQIWVDHPGPAERGLQAAAAEAAELGLGLPELNATSHLAVLDALQGRYRRAAHRAALALQTAQRHGWTSEPQALTAFLTLGLVELARQHPDTALGHLNRGLSASGKQTDRAVRLALGISVVQAHIGRGDTEAAFRADANVIAAFTLTPAAPDTLRQWAGVAGAEALLLAARPDEALTRLGANPPGTGFAASWHRVTAARAQLALGLVPAAIELLQPVLRPGCPYREPAIAAHLLSALIAERQHRDVPAITALTTAIDGPC